MPMYFFCLVWLWLSTSKFLHWMKFIVFFFSSQYINFMSYLFKSLFKYSFVVVIRSELNFDRTLLLLLLCLGFVNGCENCINISHISIATGSHWHRWIHCPFIRLVEHISVHCWAVLCLKQQKIRFYCKKMSWISIWHGQWRLFADRMLGRKGKKVQRSGA